MACPAKPPKPTQTSVNANSTSSSSTATNHEPNNSPVVSNKHNSGVESDNLQVSNDVNTHGFHDSVDGESGSESDDDNDYVGFGKVFVATIGRSGERMVYERWR